MFNSKITRRVLIAAGLCLGAGGVLADNHQRLTGEGYAYTGPYGGKSVPVGMAAASASCSATCTTNGNRLTASASGPGASCGRGQTQAQVFARTPNQTTACNCSAAAVNVAGINVPPNRCVIQ